MRPRDHLRLLVRRRTAAFATGPVADFLAWVRAQS